MQENVKQVIVKMTARRAFRTEPIWQYDTGHELVFEGFDGLPATFQVHFSLSPMGQSITQIGQNGVCTLPDMYTRTAAPIYAWLYIAETDTGLTKYSIEIPVQRRAKITNQEPTPVEQSAIDQAIAALNAGVEAAEDAQEAAEAAQASAESYAESAGQSAITATNAATSAAASAGNAAASATSAGTSATDANASRQAADLSATNAGVSERNAAASASAAAGSATSAATSAGQASASATAASGSASTASTKAGEAAQSATAAAGSAASASEDAGTASTAATVAEGSATAAAGSATAAAGSATSAGQSATAAAGSASDAAATKAYMDEHYGEISEDVSELKSAVNVLETTQVYTERTIKIGHININSFAPSNNYMTMETPTVKGKMTDITFSPKTGYTAYLVEYDNSMTLLNRIRVGSITAIIIVPNDHYVQLSVYKSGGVTEQDFYDVYGFKIKTGLDERFDEIEKYKITNGVGYNLFDPLKASYPAWYYVSGEPVGKILKNPTSLSDQYNYCAYAVESVNQYEKISIRTFSENRIYIYAYYFTDSDDVIVATGNIAESQAKAGVTLTVPPTAKRLLLSVYEGGYLCTDTNNNKMMVNVGEHPLPYEPYQEIYYINGEMATGVKNDSVTESKIADEAISTDKLQDGCVTPEKLSGAIFDSVKLKCPPTITAITGDKVELFYKGMINAVNTDNYEVDISFSDNKNRGQGWNRKYTWKPTASDIGTYTMTVKLLSNAGQVLDTATVTVNVVATPTSPASQKVILCVGDSLTAGGQWPIELNRRLTGSGGTPAGYNLNNFTFIGTKEKENVRYEGYGGWTFSSYNNANTSDAFMWITTTHDKTDSDQHSVYVASNGTEWYLETIEQGQIKIIRSSGSAALPATGTLTWVSGGEHQTNIVYTASQQAPGNPFWDSTANQNDFAAYATRMGVSSIDYCLILLGWNSTSWGETAYKNSANSFINRLLEQFPNCKVVLLGLEVPAYDGLAANYGISWRYYEKLQFVWNLNQWYTDIAGNNQNVYFANVSAEFDTEYNMQTGQMAVNTRNSETVTVQNNGVHPANSGYLQIADVALRAIAGIL